MPTDVLSQCAALLSAYETAPTRVEQRNRGVRLAQLNLAHGPTLAQASPGLHARVLAVVQSPAYPREASLPQAPRQVRTGPSAQLALFGL
jgi:hypothetical protein